MFRLLIAGEYAISMPSLLHDLVEAKEKGSPVDFVKSAPPAISAQQLGIYGKAPHLNAAKLFTEWMIAPEGQLAVATVGRETSRKGIKSKASVDAVWGAKVKPIAIVNKAFTEDPRKWLDENVKPVWENQQNSLCIVGGVINWAVWLGVLFWSHPMIRTGSAQCESDASAVFSQFSEQEVS
jgi:hypothetical protein